MNGKKAKAIRNKLMMEMAKKFKAENDCPEDLEEIFVHIKKMVKEGVLKIRAV